MINGVQICAATLWTRIPRNQWRNTWGAMSDFDYIADLHSTASTYEIGHKKLLKWHCEDADWLIEQTADSNLPMVILTHHAPSANETISPEDLDTFGDMAKYLNCTNLEPMMAPHVRLWVHGHTHYNSPILRSGAEMNSTTVVVSNQRGHENEPAEGYNAYFRVEVNSSSGAVTLRDSPP